MTEPVTPDHGGSSAAAAPAGHGRAGCRASRHRRECSEGRHAATRWWRATRDRRQGRRATPPSARPSARTASAVRYTPAAGDHHTKRVATKAYFSVQLMLICAVVTIAFCAVFRVWNIYRNFLSSEFCLWSSGMHIAVFWAIFANLVHRAAVAPIQNVTRRAQKMHLKHKKCHQLQGPPDCLTRSQTHVIGSRSALAMVPSKLNPRCAVLNFS